MTLLAPAGLLLVLGVVPALVALTLAGRRASRTRSLLGLHPPGPLWRVLAPAARRQRPDGHDLRRDDDPGRRQVLHARPPTPIARDPHRRREPGLRRVTAASNAGTGPGAAHGSRPDRFVPGARLRARGAPR